MGRQDTYGMGAEGNEQLTAMVAMVAMVLLVLLAVLAVLGVTILRIGQLIWLHLFLGMALLGPVAAKLGSTGYRFLRYYTGSRPYRLKGPPPPVMRLIGPGVVISTVVVFLSGFLLLVDGPSSRGQFLLLHKASFFVWLALPPCTCSATSRVSAGPSGPPAPPRREARPDPPDAGSRSRAPGRGGGAGARGGWAVRPVDRARRALAPPSALSPARRSLPGAGRRSPAPRTPARRAA